MSGHLQEVMIKRKLCDSLFTFVILPGTDGYVQFTGMLNVVSESSEGEITIIKRQFRTGSPFHMQQTREIEDTVTLIIIVDCGNAESWNY